MAHGKRREVFPGCFLRSHCADPTAKCGVDKNHRVREGSRRERAEERGECFGEGGENGGVAGAKFSDLLAGGSRAS